MTLKVNLSITVIILVLSGGCTFRTGGQNSAENTNSNVAANAAAEPAGTPSGGGGESAAITAANVVADLYKRHDAKKSPFFQTKDRGIVDKFFTKRLGV